MFRKKQHHLKEIENLELEFFQSGELSEFSNELWNITYLVYEETSKFCQNSHDNKLKFLQKNQNLKYTSQKDTSDRTKDTIKPTNLPTDPKSQLDKVVIATERDLPPNTPTVLSKGPNFAIAPYSKQHRNEILHNTEVGINRVKFQLRWKAKSDQQGQDLLQTQQTPSNVSRLIHVLHESPFEKYTSIPPIADALTETLIENVSNDIMNSTKKHIKNISPNFKRNDQETIKTIKNDDNILIKRTDKSKTLSIQNKEQYISKMRQEHLSDLSTYKPINNEKTLITEVEQKVNHLLKNICARNKIPYKYTNMLISTESKPGELYGVLKDHKTKDLQGLFPQRPVVSGPNTPTEKLSWLFEKILHNLLNRVPAHIESENELITYLDQISNQVTKDSILFSLDVVALYPSIPIEAAISAVIKLMKENINILIEFGVTEQEIEQGLNLILKNNLIKFENQTYLQNKGVSMGNRLAPLIAIIFMNNLETTALNTADNVPILFKRYIDDYIGIWNSDRNSLQKFYDHMNSIDPNIKFTIEMPDETGWLSFLRMKLKVNNNFIERSWYRKPTTKPIFLHANSHHPTEMKQNVIINEFRCIDHICNKEENYQQSSRQFKNILIQNGYNEDVVNKYEKKARNITKYLAHSFSENKTTHTVDMPLEKLTKERSLQINRSRADGHCLLHSIVSSTGIPLSELKHLITTNIDNNKDLYSQYLDEELNIKQQTDDYISNKNYNQPIVDLMPMIISNTLNRPIYIFEPNKNKTLITKLANTNLTARPILLRRANEHYDSLNYLKPKHYNNTTFKNRIKTNCVLKIPYINDQHTKEIKNIIYSNKLPIMPIFTPGITIQNKLIKTSLNPLKCNQKRCPMQNVLCYKQNVVYELTCIKCKQTYIGETKRNLHTRIKEHQRAIERGDINISAMAQHYQEVHPSSSTPFPAFYVKILQRSNDHADRLIKEAIYIRKLKPNINRDLGWNSLSNSHS